MVQDIEVPRFLVYSHLDIPIFEVDERQLFSATMVEEINGEHSLTLQTTQGFQKQQRIIMRDETGKVREWVVVGITESHENMSVPMNTVYCVWSLQHDLDVTIVNSMPGVQNPVSSTVALQHAIAGTQRWTVGTVTQNTTGGGSMYYLSGWEAMGVVVKNWGGEVDSRITINTATNEIISREVCLYNQLGTGTAVRRFDYTADLKSMKRTVADFPFTCRITPRGKGEETENGGYARRITIRDVNPTGEEWIEDAASVNAVRVPDGNGGYEYPNQIVVFADIENPQELYDYALAHMTDYTRPRVTYEADVAQFAQAGMDAQGLALGDVVQCVDMTFPGGLRIEGRVRKLVTDLFGVDEVAI